MKLIAATTLLALAAALPALGQDLDPQTLRGWEARAAVEAYYAAIDAEDYATAYRIWDNDGAASGKTEEEFAAGFAETAHVRVFTGAVEDSEGAAGSTYVTVPVRIEADEAEGLTQRFSGTYVMRMSEVDGAVPGWHINSADIASAE